MGSKGISAGSRDALLRIGVMGGLEDKKWLEYAAVPSRLTALGDSVPQFEAAMPTETTERGQRKLPPDEGSDNCPPRLDRCHETRTKQTLAWPQQREQPAPQSSAPTSPDPDFR